MINKDQKVIVLDRDGVLNADLPQSLIRLEDLTIIGSVKTALALFKEYNYRIVVASNQACVGRGDLSRQDLNKINDAINNAFGNIIDQFYICPHTDSDNCDCRKPKPGLLRQIWEDYHFIPEDTWFVGDAVRDFQAAQAFGCRFAFVLTGKGESSHMELPDVPFFPTLLDFANALISGELR